MWHPKKLVLLSNFFEIAVYFFRDLSYISRPLLVLKVCHNLEDSPTNLFHSICIRVIYWFTASKISNRFESIFEKNSGPIQVSLIPSIYGRDILLFHCNCGKVYEFIWNFELLHNFLHIISTLNLTAFKYQESIIHWLQY